MSILDSIKPIRLLRGSHKETGETGSGCMMNVISYLQGDVVITDDPKGVCPIIKHVCILVNDFLHDHERQALHEYIFRAMNSAAMTERIRNRRERIVDRACKDIHSMMERWTQKYVPYRNYEPNAGVTHAFHLMLQESSHMARELPPRCYYDNMHAISLDYYLTEDISQISMQTKREDEFTRHAELVKLCMTLLDDLLPDVESFEPVHEERAIVLVETARTKGTIMKEQSLTRSLV